MLAGDGTLLRTLAMLGSDTPVLGVNFGMLGFLSGASHDSLERAVESLATGAYRTVQLPGLEVDLAGGTFVDMGIMNAHQVYSDGVTTLRIAFDLDKNVSL